MPQQKRNWLIIAGIFLLAQMTDKAPMGDNPYWSLYAWGFIGDCLVFSLIYLIRIKEIWLVLLGFQALAGLTHLAGFTAETLHQILGYEFLADFVYRYTDLLSVILLLKIIAMLVGGHGIRRGILADRRADYRGHDHGGIIVSRDYDPDKIGKREWQT